MKTSRKLLCLVLVMILALFCVAAVSCDNTQTPPGGGTDNGGPTKTEWPEAGVYYFDDESGENTLTLNAGGSFSLYVNGTHASGSFELTDSVLELSFNAQSTGKITANYAGDSIAMTYDSTAMTFVKKANFTVSFDMGGADAINAQTVLNGRYAVKPAEPTRDGFVFVGWYADAKFTTPYAFATSPVLSNTTVYARWTEKATGDSVYNVALNANCDGVENPESKVTFGGKLFDLPTLEREGYTFGGWWFSTEADGDKLSHKYEDDMVIDSNVTLYALWVQNAEGDKLTPPTAVVSGSAVKWNSVSGATRYRLTITSEDGTAIFDEVVGTTTKTFDFESYPAGDYKIEVVAIAANADNSSDACVRYYKNKALAKVSAFQVIDGMLIFNSVAGAEKYIISVDCGNANHKHTSFDNGTSTTFNFANCSMKEGGITFTVTAVANGYASSVSETFVYDRTLAPVAGVTYDAATDTFNWAAVDYAAGYTVVVTVGDNTYTFNNGNATSFSVKGYTGNITVAVTPVTNGYNSPVASSATCTKTAPAAPEGLNVLGNILTWNEVDGATAYEVKIGSQTYTVNTASFDLSTVSLNAGATYSVYVKTIKDSESSVYSEPLSVAYLAMTNSLVYKNNTLYWSPVVGVSNFEYRINGGPAVPVVNATSVKLTFNKAGVNTVEVRYTDAGGSNWVSIEVTTYAVTYKSRSLAGEITEYVAIGDTLTLPTEFENNGYTFTGWYNTPSASAGNGAVYSDKVFLGNSDLVLYADWTPNSYKVEFQVDGFEINNLTQGDKLDVTYTQDFKLPVPTSDNPVYEQFVGWFTGPSGSGIKLTDENGNGITAFPFYRDTPAYPYFNANVLSYELLPDNTYAVYAGPNFDSVTHVYVPYTYAGLPVSTVLENGFANQKKLVSISIPDSVALIGSGAFAGDTLLEEIVIYEVEGNHDRNYRSEDGALIRYDMGTAYLEAFPRAKTGTFTVPSDVNVIRNKVFQYSKIEKVIISKSVTTIQEKAFYFADGILFVEFEGGRTAPVEIDSNAFYGTYNITNIKFPANIENIDTTMFDKLENLAAIEVEKGGINYSSVNGMLTNAYEDTIIYAPKTVTGKYTVPNTINHIGAKAFYQCTGITEIVIPKHVLSIGDRAFAYCANVEKITFEGKRIENLTTGTASFSYCSKLHTVTFGGTGDETTTETGSITLGAQSFTPSADANTVLRNVVFENGTNVKALGTSSFEGQKGIYTINYGKNIIVEEIGASAFKNCSSLILIDIPASTKKIGNNAFDGCSGALSVTFNEGGSNVTFGSSAFANCTKLAKVEIPSTVTVFPGSAFNGCDALNEIIVSKDNKNITAVNNIVYGIDANKNPVSILFYPKALNADPETLKTLPWDTITTIGETVFSNNKKVTELVIGKNVTTIENGAFSGCTALTKVTTQAGGSALTIGNSAFEGCTALATVELPAYTTSIGNKAFYKAKFASFTMPASMVQIGSSAFEGNTSLAAITITAKISSVGAGAFAGCTSLATVTFEESATKVALLGTTSSGVFQKCSKVTTVDFKGRVTEIGAMAFSESGITSINFNGITTIGAKAFYKAKSLTEVYIPTCVTSIGDEAFSNATALEYFEFQFGGTDTLEFGEKMFQKDSKLVNITLPARISVLYTTILSSGNNGVQVRNAYLHFDGCTKLENINFEPGDGIYASVDGALYELNVDGKPDVLVYVPIANKGTNASGELIIPKTVTLVENDSLVDVRAITKVSVEEFASDDPNYGTPLLYLGSGGVSTNMGSHYVIGGKTTNTISEVELPSHLAQIGAYCFNQTKSANLTVTFNLAANDVKIGKCAFGGSYAKTLNPNADLILPRVSAIGTEAFSGCKAKLVVLHPESTVRTLEGRQFQNANLGEFVLPKGVKTLGSQAFWGAKMTSFSVAEESILETIGVNAVAYMSTLESIDLTNATKLTTIENLAFYDCGAITEFTFPEAVVSVGAHPFQSCESLEVITLSSNFTAAMLFGEDINSGTMSVFNDVPNLQEIRITGGNQNRELLVEDGVLYDKLKTILYCFPVGREVDSFTIPSTVKIIENGAFDGYKGTSVVLPDGLEEIRKWAFNYAENLTEINIPAEVKVIGDSAFYNCANVTKVTIPANSKLETIEKGAFQSISKITSIYLPDGLTSIASYAFYGCSSLETVILPAAITVIDELTFASCTSLHSVTIQQNVEAIKKSAFQKVAIKTLDLPAKLQSIGDTAFTGVTALTEINFAKNSVLESIGSKAFEKCSNVKALLLPESVKTFGASAFVGMTALEEVNLPKSMTDIPANMFTGAVKLSKVNIPASVETIGANAFMGTAITELYLPSTLATIGASAFEDCTSLESVVFDAANGITVLGTNEVAADNIFKGATKLSTVVLPAYLQKIGGHVFENTAITEIKFPSTLTTIGAWAFANVDTLTEVEIFGNVTYVGDYAFFDCDKLTDATLSFGLEYLGGLAFGSCEKLSAGYIPATVISLGANPYAGCTSIDGIVLDPDNLILKTDENGLLYDSTGSILYYYPSSLTAETVTLPKDVEIAAGAFAGAQMKTLIIPGDVGHINAYTFSNCANLETVTIGMGINSIGDYAFEGCVKLDNVQIPPTALELGKGMFSGCTSLTSVSFAETTEDYPYAIGSHFYENCTSLTTIILPNFSTLSDEDAAANGLSGTSSSIVKNRKAAIPSYMFAGSGIVNAVIPANKTLLTLPGVFMNCKDLETVTFEATSVGGKALGNYLFYGCESLTEFTLPAGMSAPLDNTQGYTFANCTSLTKVTIRHTPSFLASAPMYSGHMFENCTSLTEVVYEKATASSGGSSGGGLGGGLGGIVIGPSIGGGSASSYDYTTDYLTAIGPYYFAGCTSLTTFTVGNNATILDYAFAGCTALNEFKVYDASESGDDDGGNTGGGGLGGGGLVIGPGIGGLSAGGNIGGVNTFGITIGPAPGGNTGGGIVIGPSTPSDPATANVTIQKLGSHVFDGCTALTVLEINAALPDLIGSGVFNGFTTSQTIKLTYNTAEEIEYFIAMRVFDGCNATVLDAQGNPVDYKN